MAALLLDTEPISKIVVSTSHFGTKIWGKYGLGCKILKLSFKVCAQVCLCGLACSLYMHTDDTNNMFGREGEVV